MNASEPFVRAMSTRTRYRVSAAADLGDAAAIAAELVAFTHAIDSLHDDPSLTDGEVSLRDEQYLACARGERCCELTFDPLARALRDAFERLWERGDQRSIARWIACVQGFLSKRLEERLAGPGATRVALAVALSSIEICAAEDARACGFRRAG